MAFLLPFILSGLIFYFIYHMIHGVYGLTARYDLLQTRYKLEQQVAELDNRINVLQNRVSLLDAAKLDPDLLLELAIKDLAVIPEGSVIVDYGD